ncbi:RNA polymerase sigma factor [Streptomyces sp. KLOTTS4A1]|uniref:RNA polymerase sigma factor n=1 Tax=Streptomyces sp. KLOTTS4A1 TaxID=3390996 RepID=UPI0039F52881
MSVKPVEPAQRGEHSQSHTAAEAAVLPRTAEVVDLVKGDERGRERKGRKGARTRPKPASKRAAKPAGTGPARDEHSGVPRDHHGEHGGTGPRATQATDGRVLDVQTGDGRARGGPALDGSGGDGQTRAGSACDRRAGHRRRGRDGRSIERSPASGVRGEVGAGAGPGAGAKAGAGAKTGAGVETGAGVAPDTGAATGADPGAGVGVEEGSGLTPAQAFDALYAFTAPGLVRQTYLLTGRRALAKEAVERAFHKAWEQWPEVARDRDPVGWVRAAAYEYALSPWHRLRRSHGHPDVPPAEPEDRRLLDTLLSLPPSYRRTLVLHDGVGLGLPETAAETEASTPAAANRLVHAREAVAARLPELSDPDALHRRLEELACAEKLGTRKAPAVRGEGERRVRFWTRAAIAFTALIIGASAITWVTSAKDYEPPQAPGQTVTGVPPMPGPESLDRKEKKLRKKLQGEPGAGPERIHPVVG